MFLIRFLKYVWLGSNQGTISNSFYHKKQKALPEIVHSDICRPFEVPCLGGNHYFISFVDEFSRMI